MDCPVCKSSSYVNLANLRRHIKIKHPKEDVKKIAPTPKSQRTFKFECQVCFKHYTTEVKLKSHIKTQHFSEAEFDECEKFQYSNMDEFLAWKAKMEKETSTFFKKYGCVKKGEKIFHYYSCHRSGNFVSRGKGLRPLRSKTSCKINAVCPAKIKVMALNDEYVTISYYPIHQGHSTNLEHLKLRQEEKLVLSEHTAEEFPFMEEEVNVETITSRLPSLSNPTTFKVEEIESEHLKKEAYVETIKSRLPSLSNPTTSKVEEIESEHLKKEACKKDFLALLDMANSSEAIDVVRKGLVNIRAILVVVCQKETEAKLALGKSNKKENISPQRRLYSMMQKENL